MLQYLHLTRINTPVFLKSSHASYLPAYEDATECSETSAYKIQRPGNYPKENKQNLHYFKIEINHFTVAPVRVHMPGKLTNLCSGSNNGPRM